MAESQSARPLGLLRAKKDYLTEQLFMLGTSADRADESEFQVKDQVIKSIVSGQIFVAPVSSMEGQLLFNEFIKMEHEKAAKQKLIDEAVYLRA